MSEDWYDTWDHDDSTPNLDRVTDEIIKMENEPREGPRTKEEMYSRDVHGGPACQTVNKLAIASLATGIISFFFGPILGTLAILLGRSALNRIDDDPGEFSGRGLAIAGITLGIFDLVLWTTFILIIILLNMTG
jgi:uncharacterized protein DUF4190